MSDASLALQQAGAPKSRAASAAFADSATSSIEGHDTTYPPTAFASQSSLPGQPLPSSPRSQRPMQSLPPADHGKQAILFLASATVVETVIWGLPSAYGVLLNFYQQHGVAGNGEGSGQGILPVVAASMASGLMYLLGPLVALVLNPRPRWRSWAIRSGTVLCFVGLLSSSFATQAWQLLLSQGLLYSVGGSMVYYPTFSFLSEWFVARRGFANGICFAGTAVGGLIYPFVMDALLSKFGAATTLQALAVSTAVLISASLPLLRPRLPLPSRNMSRSERDHDSTDPSNGSNKKKLWKSKRLLIFLVANFAQAIGYFIVALYLPTFANAIGLTGAQGSAMLAAVNGTAVVSRVVIGIASDRMSPHIIGASTLTAACLAVLLLWGLASTSFVPLLIFSLALGLAAGGWTSLYASVIQEAAKDDLRLAQTLFGLISFTRGLGSITTAPISSFLITHSWSEANAKTAYGVANGRFGSLVLAVGLALGIAAGMELVISLSRRAASRT
ncbi:hypothetical protein OIV83_000703 [Microbotryomycetes sp. JL201]|nr:hypothetical protein OIV83_000703 [Microbotryomycetes sp. JL201]